MTTGTTPRHDLPIIDVGIDDWWKAGADGRLLIEECASCGHAYLYPRRMCPSCWSDDVRWRDVSGRGVLYTYSVVRMNDLPPFNERVPYVLAMVDLEEGPRLMTNLEGVSLADIEIGMAVQFRPRSLDEGIAAPVFVSAVKGEGSNG